MRKHSLDINKAIELILMKIYSDEFKIIDRLNQHPDGLNYYDWLHKNKLISDKEYQDIKKEIDFENEQLEKAEW